MVLNKRATEIFKDLLTKKELNITFLSEYYSVSTRTIRYDIEKINYILDINNLNIIHKKGDFLFLDFSSNYDKYFTLINQYQHLDCQDRILFILANLLLYRFINIEKISQILDVTRRTINNDLISIKKILASKEILLKNSSNKGIEIIGNEKNMRIFLIETLLKIDLKKDKFSNLEKNFFKEILSKFNKRNIEDFCSNLVRKNIYIFDYSYSTIILIIGVAQVRKQKIHFSEEELLKNFSLSKEYYLVKNAIPKSLESFLDNFDIILLTSTLYNANYKQGIKEPKFLDFINYINNLFNIKFDFDIKFLQNIYSLIKVAIYKYENNIKESNITSIELPPTYLPIYFTLKNALELFLGSIYEEDIISFTILFKNFMDNKNINIIHKKDILIIDTSSNNWKGKIIKQYLHNLFQVNNIEIIEIYSLEKFFNFKNINYDFILLLDCFEVSIKESCPIIKLNFYDIYKNPYILENYGLLRKSKV